MTDYYEGPGQKYGDYSAFGQITGLCAGKLQAVPQGWQGNQSFRV
jgi:hypothetical protein